MRAVGLTRYLPITDPQSLMDLTIPKPVPTGRDLLVRVEAISVNPVDTKVRKSKSPDITESSPRVLGWDAAGVVEAGGPEADLFKPGDEVFYAGSITRPGANSEYHLVDERIVGRKPASLDFAQAAALPLTSITAWELLFEGFGIEPGRASQGRRLLIIAGAGGVGSVAIQFAKYAGLHVTATASRPESADWCRRLGADVVVDHHQPLGPQLATHGIKDFDYIANFSDTDTYWAAMAGLIAPQGKVGLIVDNKSPLDVSLFKSKSASVVWEFMFTKAMFQTPDIQTQRNLLNMVSSLVDSGKITTTHTETLGVINAANLREAHARLESGRSIGKLVLSGWK